MPEVKLELDDDWYAVLEHGARWWKVPTDAFAHELLMSGLRAGLGAMAGGEPAEIAEHIAGTEMGKGIIERMTRLKAKHSGEAGIGT